MCCIMPAVSLNLFPSYIHKHTQTFRHRARVATQRFGKSLNSGECVLPGHYNISNSLSQPNHRTECCSSCFFHTEDIGYSKEMVIFVNIKKHSMKTACSVV